MQRLGGLAGMNQDGVSGGEQMVAEELLARLQDARILDERIEVTSFLHQAVNPLGLVSFEGIAAVEQFFEMRIESPAQLGNLGSRQCVLDDEVAVVS